jgi:hypothetical protein
MIVVGGIYLLGSLSSSASGQTTRRARTRSLKFTGKALSGVNFVAISLFHVRAPRDVRECSTQGRRCSARLNAIGQELRAN